MKKLNLIKRLWTDSHEKQKMRGMRRYAAMLLLLFMCVTHAWADSTVKGGDVYFDAGGSGWSVDNVQFVIGHGSYSNREYNMTAVTNTLLFYYSSPSWGDASYFAFASGTSSWSDSGQPRWSSRCGYATKSTTEKGSYTLNSGNAYVFKSNGTGTCDGVESDSPYGWLGNSGYSDLNKTITVAAKVSTDGGANYSSAASPGTLSASSYSFTAHGDNCKNSTSLSDGTITCGYTANTTLTAGAVTGYTIMGWYDGDGDKLCNNGGTINPRADATVYAYYKLNQYTVSYGVNSSTRNGSIKLNSGSAVTTTGSSTLNHGTSIAFTASPSTGYQVEGWYSDAACSSNKKLQSGGTSYNAGTLTAATTVYVKFEVRTGGTVTLSAGTGGQVSLDNSNWGASKAKSEITTATAFNIYAQASTGYTFSAWAKSSGSGTITSTSSASTTFTPVAYEDATVTASFTERMSTLTTSCAYDAGTPGYSVPSKSVSSIGIATTADVTATAPGTGYTFAGWTLTHCVRTDDNGETSRSITIRSDGSGSAATAQANYEEDLTSTYYLVGNNLDIFPGDATWTASDSKNMLRKASGSSTGNVGSITIDVKSIPANNSDYQFKIHESTASKWWGWGKDASYYWMNDTKTTSLYDNEHNLYFIPNALGDYTFSTDWSDAGEPSLTVTFPATTYTVNFGYREGGASVTATYGGTSFASGTKVQSGKSVTFTYTKASGYNFAGWYDASTGGSKVSSDDSYTTTINGATTIYAAFTPITYNSGKLDKNGGSADGSYSVTYMGTSITPSAPTKTGYHVDGYYAEAGTSTHIATAAGVLQNDKSGYTDATGHWNYAGVKDLYAKWAANTYTAENNIDGNSGSNGKYTATYDATSIAINTAPTRTGYNLTGYHAWGCGANTLANTAGALSASQSEDKTGGKTLTNSSSQWIYDGSDATIYADWSPKTYDITLDQEGGASGSTSVTMTYDASTHTAITNPSKTGYTFGGYWTGDNGTGTLVIATDGTLQANVSTYTGAGGIWIKDATCTLYAKWTANNYTVTLDYEETGYGSAGSGVKTSVSATYGSAMPTMGTAPTPAPGYKFMGYFTAANGSGTQYYNADGTSAANWNIASATTLYAYFQITTISSLSHPAAIAKGDVVTVDVNPVLNQDGAQNYMDICWSLLYDNDNPVESGWTVESYTEEGTKPNQVRFTLTSMASGYYKIKAVLKSNGSSSFDPCSTGTELSTIKSDLRIAGNSKVTILYEDASGNTLATSGSVEVARGDEVEVTAPDIIGYAFNTWVLGDVLHTENELTANPITISADYDGYLTAKYTKKQMIYFNNTLEWEDVYVYFYNDGSGNEYWADGYGTGANKQQEFEGNKPYWEMEHGHMTQIDGTNIWYFDFKEEDWYSTTRTKVAFANVEQSIDKVRATNDEAFFHNASVVYRTDFDVAHLPMFVPINSVVNDYTTNTGSKYYRGYWMNYPESTGFVLKIFDNTGDGASLVKERNFEFSADKAMPMSVTVDLEGGNKTYGFKIYRVDDTWFSNGGTMTNGHSGDTGQAVWGFGDDVSDNCGLTTTSAGNYTFTLSFNSGGYHQVGVHYPESTGDFRVMYTDDVRIANHDSNEGKSWLLSSVIPGNTESDTISYFVRAEGSKHPKYKIQKCTISDEKEEDERTVSWADQGTAINVPDSITENGVYNFIFTKDNSGNLVLEKIEPYEGNFYIRVDGAGSSNWDNFRAADHLMPYSDYSFNQSENPYSHYFTQWYKVVKEGGDVKVKNIKFVVANDYSVCVSDTIVQDGVADAYVDANGYITRSANIRFMYNHKTNVATRRYVDGAQESGSEFLMIIPGNSKIYAAAEGGVPLTQLTFSDKGNWVYEAEVYALPTATYKLRSKFGEAPKSDAGDWARKGVITQYFKGGPSSYATLIGGDPESETRVKIRLLYDFKTNRVVAAYQPSGTISTNLEIHADIMFMREHQGDIEQITFAEGKSISEIENIYCGLKFNKYTLNNKSKEAGHATLSPLLSRYERDIFYVSFPYDVRVSDVIGFGTYGKHWIIEYYDGAARAKDGFWIDSESYWKFVTPAMKDTFTLKAGTGYIVALDLDEMWYINDTYHADIWNNTAEVELLFPGDVNSISNQAVTYNMPIHQCTINRGTTYGDRRIKDSHWNVLGVPTFKNITGADSEHGGGSGALVFANTAWIEDSLKNDLKFIYDGNLSDNSLTAKAVKGFEFKAMHAYVVQYCGDVTFTTSATPAPSIVARRTYAEKPRDVDFRLELTKDGVMEDQTFISLTTNEDASADFVFGEDLSKEFNSKRANIYTFIGTEWAAGNTLPMSNQTTIVPVGVKTAAEGEYTFSIPEGTEGIGVVLIDNVTGARTNLGLMDYIVTLEQGQIDDRFMLEISPIQYIPTGIEETEVCDQQSAIRKVLVDGILYIVRDGEIFDAQGKRVK